MRQGHLSLLGMKAEGTRYRPVHLQGDDLRSRKLDVAATDLLACVIQEIDHLNGMLICGRGQLVPSDAGER